MLQPEAAQHQIGSAANLCLKHDGATSQLRWASSSATSIASSNTGITQNRKQSMAGDLMRASFVHTRFFSHLLHTIFTPSLPVRFPCRRLARVNIQIRNKIQHGTQAAAAAAAQAAAPAGAQDAVAEGEQQDGEAAAADAAEEQQGDEQQEGEEAAAAPEQQAASEPVGAEAGQAAGQGSAEQQQGEGEEAPAGKLEFPSREEWDKVLEWRAYKGRSKEIYDCCKANKLHPDWVEVCFGPFLFKEGN
jgi:hypothetical protein